MAALSDLTAGRLVPPQIPVRFVLPARTVGECGPYGLCTMPRDND
jgi:hypothetical protein